MKDIRFNRERFDKGNRYYGKKGISPQTAQLKVIVPLIKGKDTYDFDISKETKRADEKTLKRNDLFVVRAIGMGLLAENTLMPGHAPLLSYPLLANNALPTGFYGFKGTDAYVIYNGHLTLKTGQTVNYSGFPTSSFLKVPETQPVGVLDSNNQLTSTGILPTFSMDDVLVELPEEIVLAGTQDHRIKLEVPANAETDFTVTDEGGDPTDAQGYVVLIVEGWLYEGATSNDFKNDGANPYRNSI